MEKRYFCKEIDIIYPENTLKLKRNERKKEPFKKRISMRSLVSFGCSTPYFHSRRRKEKKNLVEYKKGGGIYLVADSFAQ